MNDYDKKPSPQSQEQPKPRKKKVSEEAIRNLIPAFNNAHKRYVSLLKKNSLVQNASFETAVYLYYISELFLKETGFKVSSLQDGLLPVVESKCASEQWKDTVYSRLDLYDDVVLGDIPPFGIWLSSDLDSNSINHPFVRAQTLFGDLLIYPECAEDYENFAVPIFSVFETAQFAQSFMSEEAKKIIEKYLAALTDVTKQSSKQQSRKQQPSKQQRTITKRPRVKDLIAEEENLNARRDALLQEKMREGDSAQAEAMGRELIDIMKKKDDLNKRAEKELARRRRIDKIGIPTLLIGFLVFVVAGIIALIGFFKNGIFPSAASYVSLTGLAVSILSIIIMKLLNPDMKLF